jgi:hypothetical protein
MRKHGTILTMCVVAVSCGPAALAGEQTPPPPYVLTDAHGVVINVTWEEAAVRKALPPGVRPVADMSGGIVIYTVGKSYGLGPYSSAYFYVNVEGYDSPDGIKANWMLQGVYGPERHVASALETHYRLPVRVGEAKIEESGGVRSYAASVGGKAIVDATIKPGTCEAASAFEHYPGFDTQKKEVVLLAIPEVGNWCSAEVVALDLRAPQGDPFSAFKVKAVKGAGEFRDWSFSFTEPRRLGRP